MIPLTFPSRKLILLLASMKALQNSKDNFLLRTFLLGVALFAFVAILHQEANTPDDFPSTNKTEQVAQFSKLGILEVTPQVPTFSFAWVSINLAEVKPFDCNAAALFAFNQKQNHSYKIRQNQYQEIKPTIYERLLSISIINDNTKDFSLAV